MDLGNTGIHHVTSGAAGAQEDVDFFTGAVGLRMIKQTVLFDGSKPIYHLYYGNRNAEIGSVMPTFPFRQAGFPRRKGSGQVKTTGLTVPQGATQFWAERFKRLQFASGAVTERFGQKAAMFSHPAGLGF